MNKQKKAKLFAFKNFIYDFMRITAALPGLIYLRPKRIYTSKKAKKKIRGGALLASNHTGFLDPMYLMYAVWYRRHRFVCHKEFMDSKAGPLFRAVGCTIPIDAKNVSIASFRSITDNLKNGELVSIFPEGHINDGSGELMQFKSGVVLMAIQSRSPIVQIYIKPPKRFYNRLLIAFDEPVDLYEKYGGMPKFNQIEEITELLQKREQELKQFVMHNYKNTEDKNASQYT